MESRSSVWSGPSRSVGVPGLDVCARTHTHKVPRHLCSGVTTYVAATPVVVSRRHKLLPLAADEHTRHRVRELLSPAKRRTDLRYMPR